MIGKKVDAKRTGKPERKEVLKKIDANRAGKPERKEVVKKAKKKYSDTLAAKMAKIMANGRYQERLGETRRKAQYRKYAQTKVDKARGGDVVTRRIKFQKAVLRGPQFVCSSCHRTPRCVQAPGASLGTAAIAGRPGWGFPAASQSRSRSPPPGTTTTQTAH